MAIHWFDADDHGVTSIKGLIADGKVTRHPCTSYQEYDTEVAALMPKIQPGDVVILDPITQLLDTTRSDAKLGTDPNVNLWDKRTKYFEGDKNYLNVYQYAQNVVMRRLRNLRARGARVITIAHEDEVIDSTNTKRIGPQVNPALVGILEGQSSDIFRLVVVPSDIPNTDIKAGTRVLYIRPSDEYVAKYNAEALFKDGKITYPNPPRYLVNPTMREVFAAIGSKPEWLTLYGTPGSGKTTLAVSEALIEEKKTK